MCFIEYKLDSKLPMHHHDYLLPEEPQTNVLHIADNVVRLVVSPQNKDKNVCIKPFTSLSTIMIRALALPRRDYQCCALL